MNKRLNIPSAEKTELVLGFMRLTDSAPLIVASERDLFGKYGLRVTLQREVSWANIRDKLIAGQLDAAQMLSPLPLLTTLGITGVRSPLLTGLVLSQEGNGIIVSSALSAAMGVVDGFDCARENAEKLKAVVATRKDKPFTFATVHLFSMHTLLLRKWFQLGGIDPDKHMRILVLPPEQMVDSLAQGLIDGYCVGEPWNSVAIAYGMGVAVASGHELMFDAPEKVLGVSADWHSTNSSTHLRLRLAIMEAQKWLMEIEHREAFVSVLAREEYLNMPRENIAPSMTGKKVIPPSASAEKFPICPKFNAGFPWRSDAIQILQACGEQIGRPLSKETCSSLAQACFRTDLYRTAARLLGWESPQADRR